MSTVKNGNGSGTNGLLHNANKKTAATANPPKSGSKENLVTFRTHEGLELRGVPLRTTRHLVVFELYNPSAMPRLSEALEKFAIVFQERTIYSGRAVVRNLLDAGNKVVCEATLNETDWTEVDLSLLEKSNERIAEEFKVFIGEWQKIYKVLPEFKVVVADMQTFFHDLRLWLEQVELGIRSVRPPLRDQLEINTIESLSRPVVQAIDTLIDRFETIVAKMGEETHPAHQAHLRRLLHPFVLSSPFAHRAFNKPLGYAGDYQMVDMMIRSPMEGNNLFSKIINIWLLGQTPAQAHRNRVVYLERRLIEETLRAKTEGRILRVFNLGCGPAAEIQRFFKGQHISRAADLTLTDFNDETLEFLRKKLEAIKHSHNRAVSFRLVKKSVNQILKERGKIARQKPVEQYDYIYCAGLFDYLSDSVCKQLMNIFYDMLAPGGLLLATNATDALNASRPFRYSMEYILDWHLIYRNKNQFAAVAPDLAGKDDTTISAEATGANLFLEVRKPKNA
jgi:extracellular factor (EF) 3-hydroxypalmitic acid methyl ester biosynthesis protein